MDINIKGILNVLDGLRRYGGNSRVLLVGSGEEYGHALPEETLVCETNPVRPFNHIGPTQSTVFVAADFCKQVAEIEAGMREAVIRVRNLDVRRDFTDVRDVVRAYALLVRKGRAGGCTSYGDGYQQGAKAYWMEAGNQSGADDWRYAGILAEGFAC